MLAITFNFQETWAEILSKVDFWFAFGFVFQCAFGMRFLVQWIASERAGRSIIPISFWYLSLVGGVGLLVYAVKRADPLFILAYLANGLIYGRNLYLIKKEKQAKAAAAADVAVVEVEGNDGEGK